jgi:FtsP/CotA-like multicopper oxidase with cupredoxin domain
MRHDDDSGHAVPADEMHGRAMPADGAYAHEMHGHERPGHEMNANGEMAGEPETFSTDTEGLPEAEPQQTAVIEDGETFELRASPVRKRIGEADVRLLAYNGSVPGPLMRVKQGAKIAVRFTNHLELETTVHWHGLRHDYLFDGVPDTAHHGGMQAPMKPGDSFKYRLRFPDPGAFWYHPHMREDYTQESGLYAPIIVEPADPDYWPTANRDLSLAVDDVLIEDGRMASFPKEGSSHTAMGRYGNVMLVNGEVRPSLSAKRGEVVRLYLLNTANTRVFRLRIPGARLKLVGSDGGRVEREQFVDRLLLAPSERWVVDAYFPRDGEFILEHVSEGRVYPMATFDVGMEPAEPDCSTEFERLRYNREFAWERAGFGAELAREPDKVLVLQAEMPGMHRMHDDAPGAREHDAAGHGGDDMAAMHHGGGPGSDAHSSLPLIEWEDTMPEHNAMSSPETMHWHLVDAESGLRDHGLHWVFDQGDRVKIRIVNDPQSDHPMQHPIHFHGQRFYELSWEDHPSENLKWKDTVLVPTGKTVDILLECDNPGSWMVHCHIAEHLEAGMMFTFEVREAEASVRLDQRQAG